jgi:hypothetical protein
LPSKDVPRDEFGRPLVVPPDGGPRVPYMRTTTFIKPLDDPTKLHRWQQRQLAAGLARRPDLVTAAAADPDDADLLDDIVTKAIEPSSAAATVGTALHLLTERLDRGEAPGHVPPPHAGDLGAYERATAGIEWTNIETFRVLDEWRVAGTADRIGRYHGRLVIADIKTGSIDYPHKFAMQLACYARSLPYDIATDRRGPADLGLDLSRGLIIHLPAGKGTCDLYEIDLEKGWEACQLAYQVWQWRSTRGLLTPAAADFAEAARTAPNIETLRELWRDAHRHSALTPVFRDIVGKRRQELATNN